MGHICCYSLTVYTPVVTIYTKIFICLLLVPGDFIGHVILVRGVNIMSLVRLILYIDLYLYMSIYIHVFNISGDLGGYLGLLLGASVVTVVEILDLIIYNMFNRHHPKEKTSRTSSRNSSTADTNSDTKTSLKTDECLVNMSRFMEQNEGNIASLNGRTKERDVTGDAADEDINAVEDSAPMKDKENDAGDDRKATTDDTGGHEIMENPSTFEIKVENKGDTIPLSDTTSMKGKENDIRDDIKVSGDKTDGNEDVDNMSMIEIEIENNVNN